MDILIHQIQYIFKTFDPSDRYDRIMKSPGLNYKSSLLSWDLQVSGNFADIFSLFSVCEV